MIDIDEVPIDCKKTKKLLREGKTKGIFQLESDGMQELLQEIVYQRFEDLIPLVALYRPGPMEKGTTAAYVRRRHKKEETVYLHPSLKPILKDTYGLLVYQDQILMICIKAAGMTPLGADNVLRAMGKKKQDKMDAQRPEFITGVKKTGFTGEQATELWELMAEFAKYGFNKNHAGAYAVLSCQTAWLKANYPTEFMAAQLTSIGGDAVKVHAFINECKTMGIQVLAPDVNVSEMSFTPNPSDPKVKTIRFGLGAIKGLGEKSIEMILEGRRDGGRNHHSGRWRRLRRPDYS